MLEGELGVREHRVRPGNPGCDGLVERRQSRRGIVLRNVGNTADAKHVLGEVAELAGREHVAGQLAMDALRVGSVDPDGRRAAGGEQQRQQAAERSERPCTPCYVRSGAGCVGRCSWQQAVNRGDTTVVATGSRRSAFAASGLALLVYDWTGGGTARGPLPPALVLRDLRRADHELAGSTLIASASV